MPIYEHNGKKYNIPDDKVGAFEKKYPNSSVMYENEGTQYSIPLSKSEAFKNKFPEAVYYQVPQESKSESKNVLDMARQANQELTDTLQQPTFSAKDLGIQPEVSESIATVPNKVTASDQSNLARQEFEKNERKQAILNKYKGELEGIDAQIADIEGKILEKRKAGGEYTINSPIGVTFTGTIDKDIDALSASISILKQHKDKILAAAEDGGVGQSFKDVFTDPNTLTLGLSGAADTGALLRASQKMERGENLSDAEKNLMILYQNTGITEKELDPYISNWYRWGTIGFESVPFMVEMWASNPTTQGIKFGTKKTAKYIAEKGIEKSFQKGLVKALGATADDLAAAAVISNTAGAANTIQSFNRNVAGQPVVQQDERGNLQYGFEGGLVALESFYRAEASSIIENYTELLGEHFKPLKDAVGGWVSGKTKNIATSKLGDKIGLSKLNSKINAIKSSDYAKYFATYADNVNKTLKTVGIHGTIEEIAEEEAGLLLNAVFLGEVPEDMWRTQLDIIGGIGLSVGMMHGAGYTLGGVTSGINKGMQYISYRNKLSSIDSKGKSDFGKNTVEWENIKNSLDNATNDDIVGVLDNIIQNGNFSESQVSDIKDYFWTLVNYRGFNIGTAAAQRDGLTDPVQNAADNAFVEGDNITDAQGRNDAKLSLSLAEEKLREQIGDDWMNDIISRDDPITELRQAMSLLIMSNEEIQTFVDYINAFYKYQGMMRRVTDDINFKIEESNRQIDRQTDETGFVMPLTDVGGKTIYLRAGNLAAGEGGAVDLKNSSDSIIVMDEEGNLKMISPKDISSIGTSIPADALKESAAEAIRKDGIANSSAEIDGKVNLIPGQSYNIIDANGNTDTVTIQVIDSENGNIIVDFNGIQTTLMESDLQAMVDAYNRQRVATEQAEAAEQAAAEEAAEQEQQLEDGVVPYNLGDRVQLNLGDDIVVGAEITGLPDDKGNNQIFVTFDEPINGKVRTSFPVDDFMSKIVNEQQQRAEDNVSQIDLTRNGTEEGFKEGFKEGNSSRMESETAQNKLGKIEEGRDKSLFEDEWRIPYTDMMARLGTYYVNNGVGVAIYYDDNGNPAVILSALDDYSYVGYFREYDKDGNPTNRWSSKLENKEGRRKEYISMVNNAQELLPDGAEYVEHTNISTDGLRHFANQLKYGFRVALDEKGNPITERIEISGASRNNPFSFDVPSGFEAITVRNQEQINNAKEVLLPYMERLGMTIDNIHIESNGRVTIDMPVLVKESAEATTQATTEDTKSATPKAKVDELYSMDLDAEEVGGNIQANIDAAKKEFENISKKKPSSSKFTDVNKYIEERNTWSAKRDAAQENIDFWTEVKRINDERNKPVFEEVKVEPIPANEILDANDYIASMLGTSVFITPESFQRETGLKEEQKQMVGVIRGTDKGGVSVERAAERMYEGREKELAGYGFSGDVNDVRNIIIDILSSGNPISYVRKHNEERNRKAAEEAERERQQAAYDQYHMTAEEADEYEKSIDASIADYYKDFDQDYFYSQLAEEENDTETESGEDVAGGEVLQGEQPAQPERTEPVEEGKQEGTVSGGDEVRTGNSGATEPVLKPKKKAKTKPSKKTLFDIVKAYVKGIMHSNGRDIITNGAILISIDSKYDKALEGEVTNKNGDVIDKEDYPNIDLVTGQNFVKIASINVDNFIKGVREAAERLRKEFADDYQYNFIRSAIRFKLNGKDYSMLMSNALQLADALEKFSNVSSVGLSEKGLIKVSGENTDIYTITNSKTSYRIENYYPIEDAFENIEKKSETDVKQDVTAAEQDVNTNPTEGQKKAGNYKMGHVTIDGMDITIENPKGSTRSGKDENGNEWSVTMNNTYGYIRGTEGVDGDHIDIFLSNNPSEGKVFVVDQVKPDGTFDEHKVMYGFNSAEEAKKAYMSNYSPGWKGFGNITEVSKEEFKKWVDSSHRKTKPFAEYKNFKKKEEVEQLLTTEEINSSSCDQITKDGAISYINGNINFATQVAYQLVYQDVRNTTTNTESSSTAGDGTLVDASLPSDERGTSGQEGGTAGRVADGTSKEGSERTEPIPSTQGAENIPSVPDGEQGNVETGTEESATDGVSAERGKSKRGSRSGRKGDDVSKPRSKESSRKSVTKDAGGKFAAERNQAIDEINGLLDDFVKAGKETLSVSVLPFNAKQLEIMGKLLIAGVKLGYTYIQEGIYNIKEWKDKMNEKLYNPFSSVMKMTDAQIDEFINDMWNYPYTIDGETRLLSEWASVMEQDALRKSVKDKFAEKRAAQKAAEGIPVKVGSMQNIVETLPYLLPQQQEDVRRAETQFFDPSHQDREHGNGKGYLFTNGTGTGKTYTGLGIIKRFVKQGKGRVLILTPSQAKVNDWAQDGKNLGLDITPLENTKDKGSGVVITTFANLRTNKALMEDAFDLIVYDESHRIMENKAGEETIGALQHYMLSNKNVDEAIKRLKLNDPFFIEIEDLRKELRSLETDIKILEDKVRKGENTPEEYQLLPEKKEKLKKLEEDLNVMAKDEKHREDLLRPQAEEAVKKTKVVFLSATPFNTVESLAYTEGYIFSYPEENKSTIGSYNHRSPKEDFLERNFGAGYRFRYGRIEKHTENPEALSQQEVQFSDYLENQLGTKSGRIIDSEYDYSRDFPSVTLDIAPLFNKALQDVFDVESDTNVLSEAFRNIFFDYNYSTALFETMKISAIIPRIKEHLAMGRKVVIFHRRKASKFPIQPPFMSALDASEGMAALIDTTTDKGKQEKKTILDAIAIFKQRYSKLLDYEKKLNYAMPREQIAEVFGPENVLYFSGSENKKTKNEAIKQFNDEDSGKNIIVIQEASGKEGISLHDTTGKHQRVLITLALPQSPITALQIEGRIYRIGNKSNAIFEYPLLGLDLETTLFGQKFNQQVSTTENLALGTNARNLRQSFAEGVLANSGDVPLDKQGVGGKAFDNEGKEEVDAFDKSVLDYYGTQKLKGKRDERAGYDYFPTPEPVGFKMVEWGMIEQGDDVLEPSAGHGAIARYVPRTNSLTAVEPSNDLFATLQLRTGGQGRKFVNSTFESLDVRNKYDVVLMNPPYGTAGRMAVDHLDKAFAHLNEGGRIVAILPVGSAEKKLEKWYEEHPAAVEVGEIRMPSVTFGRAGTSVSTKIVVIDKITREETRATAPYGVHVDLTYVDNVDKEDGLFEAIRNINMPRRTIDKTFINIKNAKKTKKDFADNKAVYRNFVTENGIIAAASGCTPFNATWNDLTGNGAIRTYQEFQKEYDEIENLGKIRGGLTRYDENRLEYYNTVLKAIRNVSGMSEKELREGKVTEDAPAAGKNEEPVKQEQALYEKKASDIYSYSLEEHSRTGEKMHIVKPNRGVNLPSDQYKKFSEIAKENNGYWNRTKKGFHFKTKEDADKFLSSSIKATDSGIRYRKSEEPTEEYTRGKFTPKEREKRIAYIQREIERAKKRVRDMAEYFHVKVRVVENLDELTDEQKDAKGWYDVNTGEITIVIPNHESVYDVMQSMLHEAVAHHGLRKLFGEKFDTFIENVYNSASQEIKDKIDALAKEEGLSRAVATEEYMASLAEDTNFRNPMHTSWWGKIKEFFLSMLASVNINIPTLTDNELRYILWRSYENLSNLGYYKSPIGVAEDVVMQDRLEVGNYDKPYYERLFRGYVGKSMSKRAVEAREDGRYPKTDFKKVYKVSEDSFNKLLELGFIDGSEWHHTSATYRKTSFYSWWEDKYKENYTYNKKEIDQLAKDIIVDSKAEKSTIPEYLRSTEINRITNDYAEGSKEYSERVAKLDGDIAEGKRLRERIDKAEKRISELMEEEPIDIDSFDPNNPDIRYRKKRPSGRAYREYNEAIRPTKKISLKKFANHIWEGYVDDLRSLSKFQDAVLKETGNKMEDYENTYNAITAMSSINRNELERFGNKYMDPIFKEISKLCKTPEEQIELNIYLIAKHGLERNEYYRKKEAHEYADEQINVEEIIAELKKEGYDEYEIEEAISKARNEKFEEKYEELQSKDYAGLTELTEENENDKNEEFTERAEAIVNYYESKHDTEPLWKKINAATQKSLETAYKSGEISFENYKHIRFMYNNYVPLRGWAKNEAAEEYEYRESNNRNGLSAAVMKAKGRVSQADDVVAQIGHVGESAIVMANRNLMKQHLLNFVENNPTDLATVSRQWYVRDSVNSDDWREAYPEFPEDVSFEKSRQILEAFENEMKENKEKGLAKQKKGKLNTGLHMRKKEQPEHMVSVKVNGKKFNIFINGNPRAAQAVNGMLNPDNYDNKVARKLSWFKRTIAELLTSKNIAFVYANLSYDLLWARNTIYVKENSEYSDRFRKNLNQILFGRSLKSLLKGEEKLFKEPRGLRRRMVIDRMMSLIDKYNKDELDMGVDVERYFYEFVSNGGETGFTAIHSVDDYKKMMERYIKDANRKEGVKKWSIQQWRGLWDAIEKYNRAAEDVSRFATYITSRQEGRSIERSVNDAKEVTVNFNVKGSGEFGAKYFNWAYVFFNAAVQAINTFFKTARKNPLKMSKMLLKWCMFGALFSLYSISMSVGDDGENPYLDLPEWERYNNICIYVPFSENIFIKIPIPHDLRPFYAMGAMSVETIAGEKEYGEAIADVTKSAITNFLPLDYTGNGGNALITSTPTVFQPLAQIKENVDYFGKPIYKKTPYNENAPEWTKSYKGTSPILIGGAKALNALSGGNEVKAGWADVNPAMIEHVIEGYFGGPGKLINKTANTFSMLWDEDARQFKNVPILSRFVSGSDPRFSGSDTNSKYFEITDEYKEMQRIMNGYKKLMEEGKEGYAELYSDFMKDNAARYSVMKEYIDNIGNLRKVSDMISNEEDKQPINDAVTKLKVNLIETLKEMENK